MDEKHKKLQNLIESSSRVCILTHRCPDPDAISSGLLVYGFITNNQAKKKVYFNIDDDIPATYSFLEGFDKVSNAETIEFLKKAKPDLVLIVDTNTYSNCSQAESADIEKLLEETKAKMVIIDHHPVISEDIAELYINENTTSASELVYKLFKEGLGYNSFHGAEKLAMFGIIGDSGRFLYKNPKHRETFKLVSDLLDKGVVIEELHNKILALEKQHITVIAELMTNMNCSERYNYSYLSDRFTEDFINETENGWEILSDSFYYFVDHYLRYVGSNKWGFAIIPDLSTPEKEYRGAFRATNDCVDTSLYAKKLGGGGHKSASGFSLKARDYMSAVEQVKQVIN